MYVDRGSIYCMNLFYYTHYQLVCVPVCFMPFNHAHYQMCACFRALCYAIQRRTLPDVCMFQGFVLFHSTTCITWCVPVSGLCVMPFYSWWHRVRYGLLHPGEAQRQVGDTSLFSVLFELTYQQPVCWTIWNDVCSKKKRGNYVTS